jgi:hypothetical protein
MIIDCDTCTAGPRACADCVVSFLTIGVGGRDLGIPDLAAPAATVELDAAEERAIGVLAASGLVPPLRMARRTG